MYRMFTRATTAAVFSFGTWACGDDTQAVNCGDEAGAAQITAHAGAVQTDGSVTIYGTVEYGPTVRSLYVAGVEVTPGSSGFNYRTWSVSVPQDRLVAYAQGSTQVALPIVANLYGGCTKELPAGEEPIVRGILTVDAGAGGDDASAVGDASVSDGDMGQGLDASVTDGVAAGD